MTERQLNALGRSGGGDGGGSDDGGGVCGTYCRLWRKGVEV